MSFMSPPVPIQTGYRINGRVGSGTSRSVRVGLLPGCVQDVFFHDVNQDTIDVLKKNGYDVHIPSVNRCCGSVHGHNGNLETARQLARELIDAFESAQVDYVVMNSAGCGAYMKEYGHLLADDTDYAERALRFAQGVLDITELFDRQGWTPPKAEFTAKVTYHEPCHLVHAQKVSREPRELIRSIPGLDFRELSEATWCCGSAGIYNITRYEDSMKVLDRKMENIKKSGAEYVVTGNPGCMIQLIYGKKKFKLDVEIIHPVTLLSRAYQREGAF